MPERVKPEAEIVRTFTQPVDAISFFSDYAQVLVSGDGITMQIYETIPGVPSGDGKVSSVTTRLRATVSMTEERARALAAALEKSAVASEQRLKERLSQKK